MYSEGIKDRRRRECSASTQKLSFRTHLYEQGGDDDAGEGAASRTRLGQFFQLGNRSFSVLKCIAVS